MAILTIIVGRRGHVWKTQIMNPRSAWQIDTSDSAAWTDDVGTPPRKVVADGGLPIDVDRDATILHHRVAAQVDPLDVRRVGVVVAALGRPGWRAEGCRRGIHRRPRVV